MPHERLPLWPEPISADQAACIYENQTAMLAWLRSRGHTVEFVPDYTQPRVTDCPPLPRELVPIFGGSISTPKMLKIALGKPCPYCNRPMIKGTISQQRPTRDHVIPRCSGGTLGNGNCLIVCERCNVDKDDLTLAEWYLVLLTKADRRAPIIAALIQARLGLDG